MKFERDTHLHSKEHVLADDLSRMMGEPKRFAAYLGIARRFVESDLRGLARYVIEKKDLPPEARGRYFFGALRRLPPRSIPLPAAPRRKKRLPRRRVTKIHHAFPHRHRAK